jgi:hypothetical protein
MSQHAIFHVGTLQSPENRGLSQLPNCPNHRGRGSLPLWIMENSAP